MSKTPKKPKKKLKSTSICAQICVYCDKKFAYPSDLEIHRLVHTGQRPFSCNVCDYSASRKSNLMVHIRQHLKEKPFKCPESDCNYSWSQKSSATQHHKIVHLGEKRFECPISDCLYKCGHKTDLARHMTTHEENQEKPFKCHLCPFKARQKGNVQQHMNNIHSVERKFKCPKEGCSFASKAKWNLTQHVEIHGEKILNCSHPNCGYKTNNNRFLVQHMRIHSPDSEKKFKCRICDYSSHFGGGLTAHMRTHTKEIPHKCKIQGSQYQAKHSSHLNQHVRAVHEKIRPLKCSFSTTCKPHLKIHQKTKNSN